MFQVVVTSRNGVRDGVKKFGATHVISITDGKLAFIHPSIPNENILRMKFDDVLDTNHPLAPRLHHIERIAAWIENLPQDAVLLVHCEAGISRSTAIAWFAYVLKTNSPPARAFQHILAIRPQAVPNNLIAEIIDQFFQKHHGKKYAPSFKSIADAYVNKLMITDKNLFARRAAAAGIKTD